MHDYNLIDTFLQYIWMPILGMFGYMKKQQDRRIEKMEDKVERVDDKVDESKLYSANTYAKITDVKEELSTISSDIKDVREMLVKYLDKDS